MKSKLIKKNIFFWALAVIVMLTCVIGGQWTIFANANVSSPDDLDDLCREYTGTEEHGGTTLSAYAAEWNNYNDGMPIIASFAKRIVGIQRGSSFHNNCSYTRTLSESVSVFVYGDDNIVNFIPRVLFTTPCEKYFMGKEYGFYIKTESTEDEKQITSTVILFDVSREDDFENDYTCSIKVSPIVTMHYAYVTSETRNFLFKDMKGEYSQHKCIAFEFDGTLSDAVIPLAESYTVLEPFVGDTKYILNYNDDDIQVSDISFGASLYNVNSLNYGDTGYSVYNDYGYFFIGNEYEFEAKKIKKEDYMKGILTLGKAIFNSIIGMDDTLGDCISAIDDAITICDTLSGVLSDMTYNVTNKNMYYPTIHNYNTRETQVSHYGNLLRASAIAINSPEDDKLIFQINDYAKGTYVVSHTDKPDGGVEYSRLEANIAMKIKSKNGEEKAFVSDKILFDISQPEKQNNGAISKSNYYMLPQSEMLFSVTPEYYGEYVLDVANNAVDVYIDGELQKKESGIVSFNGKAGNKYNIALKNKSNKRIQGTMVSDCSAIQGNHVLEGGKEYVYRVSGSKSYSAFSTQNDSVKVVRLYDGNFALIDSSIEAQDYVTKMQGECMYVVLKNESSATQTIDVVDLGETVMSGSGAIDIANGHTYGMYVFTATGAGDYVFTFKFSKNEESFGVKFYDKGFNSKVSSKVYSQKMTKYRVTLKANEFVYVVVERSPMVYGNIQASYTTQLRGQKYWIINSVKTANNYVSLKRGSVTPIYVETEDGLSLPLTRIETADMYYLSLLNSIVSIKPECRLGTTKAYADVVWVSNDESKTPNIETYTIEITIETDSNLNNAISVFNDDSGFGLKINNSYIQSVTFELTNNGSKSIHTSERGNATYNIKGRATVNVSKPIISIRITSVEYIYKYHKKVNGVENIVSGYEMCAVG